MKTAGQLVSQRVVTGFPEQRLAYVAPEIQRVGAHYCAVLEPRTVQLIGIVRFSNIVAHASTATRIFADLMEDPPLHQVREDESAEAVSRIFEQANPEEITVLSRSGEYAGLITRESLSDWLIEAERRRKRELEVAVEEGRAATEFVEAKARARIDALRSRLEEFEAICVQLAVELRDPLRSLSENAALLVREDAGPLAASAKIAAEQIRAGTERLQGVIDGIIERTRAALQDKWRTFAVVDLNEVVAQALDFLQPQLRERGACVVSAARLPSIEGHYVPLLQAVIGAIAQALRNAAPGRAPSLELWAEESTEGPVLLLRDNAAPGSSGEQAMIAAAAGSPSASAVSATSTEGDLPPSLPTQRVEEPQPAATPAGHVFRCLLGRMVSVAVRPTANPRP
ncbi:hypothetical protein DB347_06075 [Opitutaceae bacterium EW11]|nr:hypothetical protein DB347_06075 [Opitutaceae bacterium EW11]